MKNIVILSLEFSMTFLLAGNFRKNEIVIRARI